MDGGGSLKGIVYYEYKLMHAIQGVGSFELYSGNTKTRLFRNGLRRLND